MPGEISKANLKFAWDLYKKLSEQNPGANLFFSPMSIMAALSMTLAGARNNSEVEMKQTMHLSDVEATKLHPSIGELLASMNSVTEGVTMSLANKLYFDQSLQLVPGFVNLLKHVYASEVNQVDFSRQAEPTRLVINRWVAEQTHEKIKDLLAAGALNSLTRLVLVNAVYFKGMWQKQFDVADSYDGEFMRVIDDPNPLTVKYMYVKDKFNFARNDTLECSVLELPFKGSKSSMVIILPYEIDGLAKLQAALDADQVEGLLQKTRKMDVEVHLPRFKLESTFNLEKVLPQLGMRDVFLEGAADFSGITESDPLRIHSVVHKAVVEVTEEGAEAAAATAIMVVSYCMNPDEEYFMADRPFLVILKQENVVTFLGHYAGQ